MTRDQAFQHLGLPAAAEAAAIGQKYADLRSGLAAAHAAAPTPGLKAKHQQAMNQVDEAFRMAMSPAPNHPLTAPHAPEPPPVADPRVEEIIRQNAVLVEEMRMLRQAAAQPAAKVVSAVPLPKKHAAAAPEYAPVPAPAPETRPIPLRLILMCAAGLAVLAAGGIAWKILADKNTTEKATAEKATADKAAADKAAADKSAADLADQRSDPARATKDAPFINSHGMKFVPLTITGGGPTDGQQVFFCVWETREQDYAAFATATALKWAGAEDDDTHPAVNVSWDDATAYCDWLTTTEQAAGRLKAGWAYRLPTDHEWSCAVGLKEKADGTPGDKDGAITGEYPWGKDWPPPKHAGNYGRSLSVDTFEYTAPVGSFSANSVGIFDLGGNVWEWVASDYKGEDMSGKDKSLTSSRALRGGSWYIDDPAYLLSSRRYYNGPGIRDDLVGFRLLVVTEPPLTSERDDAQRLKGSSALEHPGSSAHPAVVLGPADMAQQAEEQAAMAAMEGKEAAHRAMFQEQTASNAAAAASDAENAAAAADDEAEKKAASNDARVAAETAAAAAQSAKNAVEDAGDAARKAAVLAAEAEQAAAEATSEAATAAEAEAAAQAAAVAAESAASAPGASSAAKAVAESAAQAAAEAAEVARETSTAKAEAKYVAELAADRAAQEKYAAAAAAEMAKQAAADAQTAAAAAAASAANAQR